MDSNDLQLALPSPSSSNNDSNVEYTFASPRPQNFSLPYPIIKYMFTNPNSGTAWKKLIQTCKYFFSKNPVYPVERLTCFDDKKWKADGEFFDPTKNIAKLWIYDAIFIDNFGYAQISSFIPKIYKCDLRSLELWYQNLTFDEYKSLTFSGSVEVLKLVECTISYSDGTLVTFDRLFKNVLQLKFFDMLCAENSASMFQKDTVKKLANILPNLKELSYFGLDGLTEAFDFASITDFVLKNETILVDLGYDFDAGLSDAYKEDLEKFIAKIIETPPRRIPIIDFFGSENTDGEFFDPTKNIAKLWIYDEILINNYGYAQISSFISKIYKCDLRSLHIYYQNLTFDEYKSLTFSGSFEVLKLVECTISHSDGTLFTFDRLFKNVLQLKFLEMWCGENSGSMFEKDTVKKLANILPNLKELSYFGLYGLTEAFDFGSMTDFLLKNETIYVNLTYNLGVSDAYKEDLEKFIAKMIETPPKRIPIIYFPGLRNSIFYDDYFKKLF